MYSRLGLLSAVLCAGFSALSCSAQADPSGSSPAAAAAATTVDGRLKITIFAENRSAFPASTTLYCIVHASPSTGLSETLDDRYYYAKATVSPDQVSCTVEIPYRVWVSDPTQAQMWVFPAISASPLAPDAIIPIIDLTTVLGTELSVTLPYIVFPLPRAGATTAKIVRTFI